jgi:type IV secretory pathway TrbL component
MTNSFTKKQVGLAVACAFAVALAASTLGCSPQQAVAAAAIKDKIYTVTPASVKVQAGMLSGEVTDMKVIERIEEGSGRVASPAKLTGKLVLKNTSSDQTVRLIDAKILYIDTQGNPIKLEKDRTEPTIKVASSYGSSDRLDPGQDTTQAVDVDFPVAALKAKKLKDIRIDLSYIPSQFKEEKLNFAVSIGGQ